MENLNNFTPKMIGDKDTGKFNLIHELYETLTAVLSVFLWKYEELLEIEKAPVEDALNVLNMKQSDMDIFMKRKYIEATGLTFPGLKVDMIIQNNLLELPEWYSEFLEVKKEVEIIIEKILDTKFLFPFSSLYVEDSHMFGLTPEFEDKLAESVEVYTESEQQNTILEAVSDLCEAVNTLIELKLVKSQGNLWAYAVEDLALAIENKKGETRPLVPSRFMFKRTPLNRFGQPKEFLRADRNRSSLVK
jgi:hypothetical protein